MIIPTSKPSSNKQLYAELIESNLGKNLDNSDHNRLYEIIQVITKSPNIKRTKRNKHPFGKSGGTTTSGKRDLVLLTDIMNLIGNGEDDTNEKDYVLGDLGASVGAISLLAAHSGWKVHSWELNSNVYPLTKRIIKQAKKEKYLDDKLINFHKGSFFPKEFDVERKGLHLDFYGNYILKYSNKNRKFASIKDLQEVDLFYHYQVERTENILKLFSQYAKKDAILLMVRTQMDPFNVPDNIRIFDYKNYLLAYKN